MPARKLIFMQPGLANYRIDFFARLYSELGARFQVYSPEPDDPTKTYAWHTKLPNSKTLIPGFEWQPEAREIPISKSDLVVVSGGPRNLSNLHLMMRAKRAGAKTVWWGHYRSSSSSSIGTLIRNRLMRYCDYLLLYTDQEKHEYLETGGHFKASNIFALNNGIDTSEIEIHRSEYNATERGKSLLFIGRLTQKSQLSLVLDAMQLTRHTNTILNIIGTGALEAEFRQQICACGIQDRVIWHGAVFEEAAIAEIANRCALFVYPGAVGLSLIHGLSYGLPAIVHNDRWQHMPEIAAFEDGRNGLSYLPGDAASLAETLDMAFARPKKLEIMSQAAVATTQTSYNTLGMSKRMLALYKRALA